MFSEARMIQIIREDVVMLKVWQDSYPEIEPTAAVYRLAVEKEPLMLKLVPPGMQDEEMCLSAVKKDYRALKYVHDQTPAVVDAAFREYAATFSTRDTAKWARYRGDADFSPIRYLKEKTKQNLMIAVGHRGLLIGDINEHYLDDEIKIAAIKQDPNAFFKIDKVSEAVAVAAMEADGMNLWAVKEQTPEICRAAIEQNPDAVKYVKDISMIENGPKM